MPSPLPPTITSAKGDDGKDVPNQGTLNSSGITFTGTGFPNLKLNITLTANGTAQTPSTQSVTIDATAKWSATLNNLPSGSIVVTFTEDATNAVVAPPAGTVSWSFTTSSKVLITFDDHDLQTLYGNWQTITKAGLKINITGPNVTSIRNSREFWSAPIVTPTTIDGNVLCFNYVPTFTSPGNIAFSFFNSSNTSGAGVNTNITCSKVSFTYVCQTPCLARFQDPVGNILSEQPLIESPSTAQTMTAVAPNIWVVYIYDSAPIELSKTRRYSAIIDNFEFTPV